MVIVKAFISWSHGCAKGVAFERSVVSTRNLKAFWDMPRDRMSLARLNRLWQKGVFSSWVVYERALDAIEAECIDMWLDLKQMIYKQVRAYQHIFDAIATQNKVLAPHTVEMEVFQNESFVTHTSRSGCAVPPHRLYDGSRFEGRTASLSAYARP